MSFCQSSIGRSGFSELVFLSNVERMNLDVSLHVSFEPL
jgi:hypothetical protein